MKALRMDKLRAMREEHGMSRGHLADLIGVGQSTLACWELGIREPRYEHLVFMALHHITRCSYRGSRMPSSQQASVD